MQNNQSEPIFVEICQNCRLHRWCTRHNEKKYNDIFNEFVNLLKKNSINNPVFKNHKIDNPKMGAFEIKFKEILVFSKIKSGCFPDCNIITEKIKKIINGETINNEEKKELKINLKCSPVRKNSNVEIPKYDIICPSPTKIIRAYKNEIKK